MSAITTLPYGQRQIPAIYLITNQVNGKIYVGQAVNFCKRFSRHKRSIHVDGASNRPLVSAFKKYGFDSFSFSILESPLIKDLTEREQFWMDKLRSCDPDVGYNLAPAAGSPLGVKHSAETRAKVAKASRGRRHSAETRALMSLIHTGKVVSDAAKEKNRIAHLGKKVPNRRGRSVEQLCMKTGSVLFRFVSARASARSVNGDVSPILHVCNGIRKSAYGFSWRFTCHE